VRFASDILFEISPPLREGRISICFSLLMTLAGCDFGETRQSTPSANNALANELSQFREELSLLTYHSQCPDVHPVILDPVAKEIRTSKTKLWNQIERSSLSSELTASVLEMAKQDRYSNESDCVGVPFPDDDKESLASYRSMFESEKKKLRVLHMHFQNLSKRVAA
jgi:hypothetical protein